MSVLRAKMRVQSVLQQKESDGKISSEQLTLVAVYDSNPETENAQWSRWTPSATLNINISNPDAFNKVSSGHEYFVDLTPA